MKIVIFIISLTATIVSSAPLYGSDGGYLGYASYKPVENQISRSEVDRSDEDNIDLSAGSQEITRHSSKDYSSYDAPKSISQRPNYYERRPTSEEASNYDKLKSVPEKIDYYKPLRVSSKESSKYGETKSLPEKIDYYKPIRISSEDASNYEQPKTVPKRVSSYKPSSDDSSNYDQTKAVPKRSNSYKPTTEDSTSYFEPKSEPNIIYGHTPVPRHETAQYAPEVLSKEYDLSHYKPSIKHGYGGNQVTDDVSSSAYHRATLYGQEEGGYKIADAYEDGPVKEHIGSEEEYKHDEDSAPKPYEFGYAVKDHHGNSQHRHEESDGHGTVKGTYGYIDAHGVYRSVQYIADKGGFRASIMTNEPGTESRDPADVKIKVDHDKYE